ncbi:TRAF2 and NCK-interacting protein kinase-like protein [Leptotrombidium deliense]|uniref:mitogen-activated protein kinase kinase n=1 Tax=Leptotrombidium deliense TaxID=299467 RepID=A0A443SC37_9ACAR|nr:TRAF2 and NCK-interacting protein kinase-like protein [Leptotrombidium deliense]
MADHEAMSKPLKNNITLDDFVIIDEIGSGNFGTVYKVLDKERCELYAMKRIDLHDDCNLMKLTADALVMSKAKHDNLLQYFGGGVDIMGHEKDEACVINGSNIVFSNGSVIVPKCAFILIELAAAPLLQIADDCRIDENLRINIMKQVINALYYLKSNGISFPNISPNNILVNEKNVVKLSDYGLSPENINIKMVSSTKPSMASEYLSFAAPELLKLSLYNQAIGKKHLEKADVYKIGITWLTLCLNPAKGNTFPKLVTIFNNNRFAKNTEKYMSGKEAVIISKTLIADFTKRINIDNLYNEVVAHNLTRCDKIYSHLQLDSDISLESDGEEPSNYTENVTKCDLSGESSVLQFKLQQMQNFIKNLKRENAKLETELKIKQREIKQFIDEKYTFVRDKATLETAKKYLTESNDSLKDANKILTDDCNEKKDELDRLQKDYSTLDGNMKALVVKNDNLVAKFDTSKSDLERYVKESLTYTLAVAKQNQETYKTAYNEGLERGKKETYNVAYDKGYGQGYRDNSCIFQ